MKYCQCHNILPLHCFLSTKQSSLCNVSEIGSAEKELMNSPI